MTTTQKAGPPTSTGPDGLAKLREQYGCGPVQFTGTDDALYERHLIFDNAVKPTAASPRAEHPSSTPD
jgi:starch phosphorylase